MLGSNSSRRLRPIFAFSLPERTLPGSIHVGRHTILCAQEHAGGLRVLVLARHLAEESATPHPPASAVDIDDTKSISSAASVPASSGAAARFAALRSLLPQAILQSIPLPKGTVMLLAPLTNEPPLGDFLFATRSTLHSLRPWRDPTAICRKLLQGAVQHGGESQGLDDDAASRVGLAWILARTFTLDFDALNAHANAHALINANEPPSSSSSQRRRTGFAPAALHSAVAVATSPSARSTALLLSYLGRLTHASAAGTSSATERPPLLPSNAMAALLSQLPPIDQPQRHNNGSSTTTASYHHHLTDEISMDDLHLDDAAASAAAEDEEAATAAAERRSAARVDLVRLCCHLHARLVNNDDDDEPREASQQAALERSLDTVASAALSSAPIAAARILASTGSWRPLLLLLPPIMTIKTRLLHPTLPAPTLRTRLLWLRAAAAQGALSLAPPSTTTPQMWMRLLSAVEPDGSAASSEEGSSQREDVLMLLTLALLPPPSFSSKGGAADGGTRGAAAAALGGSLEVFLQYWLRQRWPNGPLLQALRNQMRGASLALCWLLEQRPALAAQVALGPELLLDAIRVVACDTATS